MTVNNEYIINKYVGNNILTDFDFDFSVFNKEEVVVNVEDTDGNVVLKTLNTDYNVVLNNNKTGTVIFYIAPEENYKIFISRNVDILQTTNYETSSGFQAKVIEDCFDKLTLIAQQQQTEIDKTLKISLFSDATIKGFGGEPQEDMGIKWKKDIEGNFYLDNTENNPDTVYKDIVENENVIAVGTDLTTNNNIGTVADNIESIQNVSINLDNINVVSNNINNVNIVAEDIEEVKEKADKSGLNVNETFFNNANFSTGTIDYVVENGGDVHKWYRKYKSGFIEQGGDFTTGIIVSTDIRQINFLIPFTTNLYQYSFGTSYISQAVHDATICLNGDMENFKTVSSFIAQRRIAGSTYAFADSDTWFCCGY